MSEPRTANWIAEEADVAHETAVKYLRRLVEDGQLRAKEAGGQTQYRPDPVGQYLREVRELYEEHAPDELASSLEAINDQLRTWKSEFDVDSPNELRASIAALDDPESEHGRREIAREWEHLTYRRSLVEDALRLHDRFPDEPASTPA